MRFGAIIMASVFLLAGTSGGQAQTLYNSPSQQGTATTSVKPLNLQQLYREEHAAQTVQQGTPYIAPGAAAGSSDFAQRSAALNQWRNQRDAQAQMEQTASTQYMTALADSPDPAIFGVTPVAGPSSYTAPAPAAPVVYRKKEQAAVENPRRLFNTID